VGSARFSADGRAVWFSFAPATEPAAVYRFERATGAIERVTSSAREVPPAAMARPESRWVTSFDGERLHVLVFRPREAPQAAPAVVLVHGGPEGQSTVAFNPIVQYLASRGYTVAVPNVRGSTGYGKRFYGLDDVRRRLDSVRDLAAIHEWLPSMGVDAKRIAVWGGSYGGYMVLAALAFQPERWAAGVDIVGIANFVTFLQNTAAYRRRHREHEYGSLEADGDFLREISPLTHAERISAPLFIIHGANDPRVPLSETRQIEASLVARGFECPVLVYEDEGHGLAKLRNRLDAYPRAVDFLDRALGV
jgi:dipeptidyl aminopeptidase/acylaminoacyl peptidase